MNKMDIKDWQDKQDKRIYWVPSNHRKNKLSNEPVEDVVYVVYSKCIRAYTNIHNPHAFISYIIESEQAESGQIKSIFKGNSWEIHYKTWKEGDYKQNWVTPYSY